MSRAVMISIMVLGISLVAGVNGQSIEQTMTSGTESMKGGAYGAAITKFSKVLAREPHNFEAQFNLGLAYLNSGRYQEALAELSKAAGLEQRNSEVWGAMGYAYERMGKKEQAISSFSKSVTLDPNNLEARLNLASMYLTYGRANEAVNQYKQIIQIDGQNASALLNLGKCLVNMKQYAEAKQYLRQAAAADPDVAGEAHWELGTIYWKNENKPEEARKEFETAINVRPDVPVFYESLGRLLEDQGKKDQALEVYRKSLAYIDDAMKKEDIQKRIERIENPESDKTGGKGEKSYSRREKTDLDNLRKEVRGEEQKTEAKRMDVGSLNLSSDLSDLSPDEGSVDLTEEAKKRSKAK